MIALDKIRFHFCVKSRFPKATELKNDTGNNECFCDSISVLNSFKLMH